MQNNYKQLALLTNDKYYVLSELQCTGLPYLILDKGDHHIEQTNSVYQDLFVTLNNCSKQGTWKSNNIHFFDIHPVYSDTSPIGGALGFHLALTILAKGLMQNSEQLIFDTLSSLNRSKVRTIENKPYFLASWMALDTTTLEIDAHDRFSYIKTAVQLYRAREFKKLDLTPRDNSSFTHSLKRVNPGLSELDICELYTSKFLEFAFDNVDKPNLYESVRYLYALIFCREFSFKGETFTQYLLKHPAAYFDFGDDLETIEFILLSYSDLEQIRIDIGELKSEELTRLQIATDLFPEFKVVDEPQHIQAVVEDDTEEDILDDYLKRNTYSICETIGRNMLSLPHRFHNTGKPLTEDEATQLYQDYYKTLILFFYQNGIDKSIFNTLKLHYEADSRKLMRQENIASFQSRTVQITYIMDLAYRSFEIQSPILKPSYKGIHEIELPALDVSSQNEYNVLNEKAKVAFLDKRKNQAIELLEEEINNIAHKLTHQDSKKYISENITKLLDENIEQIISDFYYQNYVTAYMQIANKYEFLLSQVKQDADLFTGNQSVILSVIMEINYFSPLKKNPRHILDLNSI